MARRPVELTESAKKKLPAALKAKEKAKKMGALGTAGTRKKRARSALDYARKSQGLKPKKGS